MTFRNEAQRIDTQRQSSFNAAASNYAEARPGYPDQAFDDLSRLAGLSNTSRILEIGCGPGQATLALGKRGYEITAVDIGINLIEVVRERAKEWPNIRAMVSSFEDLEEKPSSFDVLLFASSFHWMDPSLKVKKSHGLLKEGGYLVLLGNAQPPGEGAFFSRLDGIYTTLAPQLAKNPAPNSREARSQFEARKIEAENPTWLGGLFDAPQVLRYPWSRNFDAQEYLNLLNTYSDHLTLPEETKRPLCAAIADLIQEYGGRIQKSYLTELTLARRRP